MHLHHQQQPRLRRLVAEEGLAWRRSGKDAFFPVQRVPLTKGEASILHKPSRDGIITFGMSDPNLTNHGYRSQKVIVTNARTSGLFWYNSVARDLRQFMGTTKKTLHRQSLESVSLLGTSPPNNVRKGEQDPL